MEVLQDTYKDTKIGRIPKDWEVVKLEDVFKFTNGKGHEKSIVDDGGYIVVNSKFISTEGEVKKFSDEQMSPLLTNDITMVMSDVPNGRALAKCFLIDEDKKYTLNQRICGLRLKNNSLDDVRFFFYNINRNKGFLKYNDGVGQTNLRKSEVLGCLLARPSIEEQEKVSEILSTVDEQISATERIIDKSKELKKGLMQKLFSQGIGHTEFKDSKFGRIPKDWEVKNLDYFGVGKEGLRRGPFGGALKKEIFVTEGYLVYEQQNAIYKDFNRGRYYVTEEKYQEMSNFHVKPNDLIVSCSGTIGRIAIVPENAKPGLINQALLRIRLKDEVNRRYFYYLWSSTPVQNKVLDMTQGSTMKNIVGMSTLRKTKLPLPPLLEQQKIAEILSEADKKIEKEVQYKSELDQLKKGLMQQLLTGQKRVKV